MKLVTLIATITEPRESRERASYRAEARDFPERPRAPHVRPPDGGVGRSGGARGRSFEMFRFTSPAWT